MSNFSRRQFLKLGAAFSTALLAPSGCQSLLERLLPSTPPATLIPPTTPTALPPTSTAPTTGAPATPMPTSVSAIATPTEVTAAPLSPVATPAADGASAGVSAATVPPRLVAPPGGSKLGLHSVFGPRQNLDVFLARCAQADTPVVVVKCVDDFEPAFKAKALSQKTLTVGRVNGVALNKHEFMDMQAWEPPDFAPPAGTSYTTAAEAAEQYYARVKPIWDLNPVIDVWETFNEFSWHWDWQADFYLRLMDLAEADGYRLGLWSSSAGNPPEEFYPYIARTCARAKAHGGHILCLHEYNFDGLLKDAPRGLVLRYRQLYRYLQQADAVIPLVISEAGENGGGGFTGVDVFMDDFAWYDARLSRDDYVIGCAMWTLGDWSGADFQAALPALADYITGQPLPVRSRLPVLMGAGGQP